MSQRLPILFIVVLGFAACGDSPDAPIADDNSPRPESPGSADREANSETTPRLNVGPVSFLVPTGWEVRDATQSQGLVMFAPDRPAWEQIGFRPNLSVRVRAHPGVRLDQFRETLNQMLAQSVEQVNATIGRAAKVRAGTDAFEIPLRHKGSYSIDAGRVGGVRVLTSTFNGVYELRDNLVPTKTLTIQYLSSDAAYSIALTFPTEFDEQMTAVWEGFKKQLQIDR